MSANKGNPADLVRYDGIVPPQGAPDGLQAMFEQLLYPYVPGHFLDKTESGSFFHLPIAERERLFAWTEGKTSTWILKTELAGVEFRFAEYLFPDSDSADIARGLLVRELKVNGAEWSSDPRVIRIDYNSEQVQAATNEPEEVSLALAHLNMQGLVYVNAENNRLTIMFATGASSPEMDQAVLDMIPDSFVPTTISLSGVDVAKSRSVLNWLLVFCFAMTVVLAAMLGKRRIGRSAH